MGTQRDAVEAGTPERQRSLDPRPRTSAPGRIARYHRLLGENNGCTICPTVPLPAIFVTHPGLASGAALNRYLGILGASHRPLLIPDIPLDLCSAPMVTAGFKRPSDLQCLDLGSLTASQTPLHRHLPAFMARAPVMARIQARERALRETLWPPGPEGAVHRAMDGVVARIGPGRDVSRKLAFLAAAEALEGAGVDPGVIGRALGDRIRRALGWSEADYPTVLGVSGTYLCIHLSVLAGVAPGAGGGLHFSTTETGGNAPRCAQLERPLFGADQAGRPVVEEGPICADGRGPGTTWICALRDSKGETLWGPGRPHLSYGDYLVSELQRAVAANVARHRAAGLEPAFSVVAYVPDRPKTCVAVTLEDLATLDRGLRRLADHPGVTGTHLIIDGCQSRGLTIAALRDPEGPVAFYQTRGVAVDGVAWTTSKGPGGTPFAVCLTLTRATYERLYGAMCEVPEVIEGYVCQGDFPRMPGPPGPLEARAIPSYAHQVRILGDLSRLWRWAEVCAHPEMLAGAMGDLEAAICGEGGPLEAMGDGPTDPTVRVLALPARHAQEGIDLAVVGQLLRLAWDPDVLEATGTGRPLTPYERAAARIPTPTGQCVDELTSSLLYGEVPEGGGQTHRPLLRLAIGLELAELTLHRPARGAQVVEALGRLLRARIGLILAHYDALAPALQTVLDARAEAEVAAFAGRDPSP